MCTLSGKKVKWTLRERGMAMPTMKRKKGMTKSARLQPFHIACPITGHSSPAPSISIISCSTHQNKRSRSVTTHKTHQDQLNFRHSLHIELTATVRPRNTSSEATRRVVRRGAFSLSSPPCAASLPGVGAQWRSGSSSAAGPGSLTTLWPWLSSIPKRSNAAAPPARRIRRFDDTTRCCWCF